MIGIDLMLSLIAMNSWFGTRLHVQEYFITGIDLILSLTVVNKWFGTNYK